MIKNKKSVFLLYLLLSACVGSQSVEEAMKQDPPDQYEAVLDEFVAAAKAGDIDKMLSITSNVTLLRYGEATLRKQYASDFSPGLIKCGEFANGGDYIHMSKFEAVTGSGWRMVKSCTGQGANKDAKLQFLVLNEGGKIVIASVGVQK